MNQLERILVELRFNQLIPVFRAQNVDLTVLSSVNIIAGE
jgi:hypothetical protein